MSIILSLLIVPLTINYVSADQYGIWLTVSSIVAWISYFDLGLGHGLRNKFAEAEATENSELGSRYVSTAYALFIIIFTLVFLIFFIANKYINWKLFLKIDQVENDFLQALMLILVGFFCFTMIFKIINSLLLGFQKSAYASGISVAGQFFSLVIIFIFSKTTQSSLIYLSFANSGIPCIILFLITLYLFSPKGFFKNYKPSFRKIDFTLTRDLLGLGVKFFVIQISLLLIFQSVNIIISRNCGQLEVTQYNLSYKYFSILHMISVIVLTPYWSAFTDAYTKGDTVWMKDHYHKLNKLSLWAVLCSVVMVIAAPLFFKLWVGKSVDIPFKLHVAMAIYVMAMIFASVQMYILNGIGKVTVQLIVYVFFALIAIPCMNILSKEIGLYGILIVLSIVYIVQSIICRRQIILLLNRKGSGLWAK